MKKEQTTRELAIKWFNGLEQHFKRGFVDSYISRSVNITDARPDQIEYMYLCEHPRMQTEKGEDVQVGGGKWFWNDIDGDCAICDDNGFVLEAPDEDTGKRIVTCVNNFDAMYNALKEVNTLLDGLINRTESGKKRNELCDINITVKTALTNISNK